jgi:DNA-binding CsgD family transcriptional regulator
MLLDLERISRGRVGQPLLDALDRMRCGGVLLDTSGEAVEANESAIQILKEELGSSFGDDPDLHSIRTALKRLLRRSNTRFTMDADTWVTIPRDSKRDLVLHAVSVEDDWSDCHTALIMVDLSAPLEPQPDVLQKLFGLTAAEARLAIQITRGETAADIARVTGVSIATIRSQLASVFSKTQTGRQAELVALLARVAILP